MCIKMKIAQSSQRKYIKQRRQGNNIEFSERYFIWRKQTDYDSNNELHLLFSKIEDILKLYAIANFELRESNKPKYNILAIQKYEEVLSIIGKLMSEIFPDKENFDSNKSLLFLKLKYIKRK